MDNVNIDINIVQQHLEEDEVDEYCYAVDTGGDTADINISVDFVDVCATEFNQVVDILLNDSLYDDDTDDDDVAAADVVGGVSTVKRKRSP